MAEPEKTIEARVRDRAMPCGKGGLSFGDDGHASRMGVRTEGGNSGLGWVADLAIWLRQRKLRIRPGAKRRPGRGSGQGAGMGGEHTTLEQDGPLRSSHKYDCFTQRIELITSCERRRRWSIGELFERPHHIGACRVRYVSIVAELLGGGSRYFPFVPRGSVAPDEHVGPP